MVTMYGMEAADVLGAGAPVRRPDVGMCDVLDEVLVASSIVQITGMPSAAAEYDSAEATVLAKRRREEDEDDLEEDEEDLDEDEDEDEDDQFEDDDVGGTYEDDDLDDEDEDIFYDEDEDE